MLLNRKYDGRMAICKEHTGHHWCGCRSFRNLQMVDTSFLRVVPLLPVRSSRAGRRWEASWQGAVSKKVSNFSTVETSVLGSLSLGWCRCSDIQLLLRGPIVLRPLSIWLWCGPNNHLLLLWLLVRGPGRCLVYNSRSLGHTTRRSSCDPGSFLLKLMKTEVFFHG